MKNFKILFAVAWSAWQFLLPAACALAQAQEAEAGAQFQGEVQGSEEAGGPIIEPSESSSQQMPQASPPGAPLESVPVRKNSKTIPLYEGAEAGSPLDARVTVRVKNAPLAAFLDSISAQSKINFIITEGLEEKKVTAFLRQVMVREALQILLQIKGLSYQRIGKSNTYVITKRSAGAPNLLTKIYTLNYIPLAPVLAEQEDTNAIAAQDASGIASKMQAPAATGGGKEGGDNSGIAIIAVLRSVLSKSFGKIAVEPRTNSLIVTDIPENFPQVEQILLELDKKAPQVLIEAQIVEIDTDRVNELGIEWGGARGEIAYFAGPARTTDWGLRPGFFSGDEWKTFFTDLPARGGGPGAGAAGGGGADSGGGGGGSIDPIFSTGDSGPPKLFQGIFSLAQLQAILRALISRSEARFLGKPKVVTLNNKTALVQITKDAAVGTASVVVAAGGAGGSSSVSIERKRVGLWLKVTPQVNKEGYITLLVQPSFSDVVPSGITVQGSSIFDPVSRGVSTLVRVKNGQTVVLGGLLSSTEKKLVKKVPLLGYIPILGWLFTSVSSRMQNTDLVLFLTPTILVD